MRSLGDSGSCGELRQFTGPQEVELGSWGAEENGDFRELEAGGSLGAEGH